MPREIHKRDKIRSDKIEREDSVVKPNNLILSLISLQEIDNLRKIDEAHTRKIAGSDKIKLHHSTHTESYLKRHLWVCKV